MKTNYMTEKEIRCRIIASKYLHPNFVEDKDPRMLDGTFKQLWNYCGLQNLGIDYIHQGPFEETHKREIIYKWLKVLYNASKIKIEELESLSIERMRKIRTEFLAKNPDGHITLVPFSDALCSTVENELGKYR